jgi:thiol-disulfide isomerase/thioredoxin
MSLIAVFLMTALLTVGSAFAQEASLQPGDPVEFAPIAAGEALQGELPDDWEEDKLYMIECWATWCGPCLQTMPHLNELSSKYKEDGLRVIGVNVFDQSIENSRKFLDENEGFAEFPMVFAGQESAFQKDWLTPAGVQGIPHTFLVKDGKLLISGHPMTVSDEVIEGLLAGGEVQAAAIEKYSRDQIEMERQREEFMRKQMEEQERLQAEREKRLGSFQQDLQALVESNKLAEALALTDKTLAENENVIERDRQELNLLRGQLLMGLQRLEDAIEAFRESARHPADPRLAMMAEQIVEQLSEQADQEEAAAEEE